MSEPIVGVDHPPLLSPEREDLADSYPDDESVGTLERARGVVLGHPLLTVAALAVVVGLVNLAWAMANRRLGGLDVDEVSYLTQTFRWHRMVDPSAPFAVPASVLDQDKGPITMLVSVAALLVGANTIATAFAASVFLHGVSAVAVAGIANRLAGSRAALVSGLVALALPAAVVAARSYQLAPAVGAGLTLAVWSLLASSRGRRLGPMLAFGASVAILLLSRTMAVSFIPGLVIAGALHLDRTKEVLRNATLSIAVAVALAGRWYWAQREPISEYLFGHGYGASAEAYGPSSIGARFERRWVMISEAVGPVLLTIGCLVVIAALVHAGLRALRGRPAVAASLRSGLAVVWITVALGMAALMSTANLGMYFELPLLLLAVPGVAGLTARLPRPARGWIGGVAAGVAVMTLVVSVMDTGGRASGGPGGQFRSTLFVGLANYQRATVDAEPRLGSPDREVRREAMDEWWGATRQVVLEVDALVDEEPIMQTICGSGPQLNAGAITLAGELDQRLRDSWFEWLPTTAPPSEMERLLQPLSWETPRIVVIIESPAEPFPGDETSERCAATAERLGWRTEATVALPDGGVARVMVHPENR
jgi:4-amino-4-deoxy-L-arabinose transferase-like glycosyltransferase